MPDIVHICYPGIGGQAAVATGLAVEGVRAGVSQGIIFYGVEPTAHQYLQLCHEHGIEQVSILKKPGVGVAARRELTRAVRKMDARMIVSHHHDTAVSVASAAILGFGDCRPARIFVEHHSNALKSSKDWVLSTLAHRLSDHTVYLTDAYRDQVREKVGRWFSANKTSVIGNGLDLSLYQPATPSLKPMVIGMQGRMDVGKDYESLIRAFAALDHGQQSIRLDLIGDGPDRPHLEKLCSELGVSESVDFAGFLSQHALIDRMKNWNIAVLMTMGETLSMAILEYWALKIPLITTRVPGVESLVTREVEGLLVAASNVSELTTALTQLIADPVKAEILGESARKRVEQEFDRTEIWNRYIGLADRLAPQAPSSTAELSLTKSL